MKPIIRLTLAIITIAALLLAAPVFFENQSIVWNLDLAALTANWNTANWNTANW